MSNQLTEAELALLKQCDGKHADLTELFECASCEVLLNA